MSRREAILALRLICENKIELDKSSFISFMGLEKIFNNNNWTLMVQMLRRANVDYTGRRLLFKLHISKRNSYYKNWK